MSKIIPLRKTEKAIKEIIYICSKAWDKNLMPGLSGNASIRLSKDDILITGAGAPKGFLTARDCILMNFEGKTRRYCRNISSEWRMHTSIYKQQKGCRAILHTHPKSLQIIDGLMQEKTCQECESLKSFLSQTSLYEAKMWLPHLVETANSEPGTIEVAKGCMNALSNISQPLPIAIWLRGHGLTVLASTLLYALAFTEELNHIAEVCLGIRTQQHKRLNSTNPY